MDDSKLRALTPLKLRSTILQLSVLPKVIIEKSRVGRFVKFIYSEKVTKFCEISTLLLSYVVLVKSKVDFSQILWPSKNI